MELLERDGPLAQLTQLLAEARAGQGRIALVSGEAGIGKTSLVRAFVGGLPAGMPVSWGSCDPLTVPRPFGPFRDMAALAPAFEAHAGRHEILQAIVTSLEGGRPGAGEPADAAPRVLVIEDVHWADEATIDALRFVGRRIDRTSGLLVATIRDDDQADAASARTILGDLATAPGYRRLALEALSADAVAVLAADRGLDPRRLHDLTGGNAFYVTEVLAAPGLTVPTTVVDAVLARVARLDDAARRLLELVAIAPNGLAPEVALAAAEDGPETLDACLDHGVLVLADDRVRFRHELARLAIEGSIAATRRRRLHARLLDELERAGASDASILAHHAAAAGDPRLLRHGRLAATEASARGAHRAAAEHLGRTVAAAGALPPVERADLLSDWTMARAWFDDPVELIPRLDESLRLRRAAGDRLGEGRDLGRMARLVRRTGDTEAAGRLLDDAIRILEGEPPSEELALCHAQIATHHVATYRLEAAIRHADRAIELGRTLGSAQPVILGLDARAEAVTIGAGPEDRGIALSEEAHRLALDAGDPEGAASALLNAGGNLLVTRRYAAARDYLDRAIRLGASADLDYLVDFGRATLARVDFEAGRWAGAAAAADELLASDRIVPIVRVVALTARGRVEVRRGDPVAGGRLLETAWELAASSDLALQWTLLAGLAEAAWWTGRQSEIAGIVGDAFDRTAAAPVPWAAGELGFWLWRAREPVPDPGRLAEPWARRITGDWRAAAAAWARLGCPYEQADALADGDEPALREALAIFTRLGADPDADRVRERMRRSGITRVPARPQRSTRSAPAQLTRRQLEILGLLVDGLSNAEIAARLFITEKTAGHHVSAILAKLDARSRAEAAATARNMGITAPRT